MAIRGLPPYFAHIVKVKFAHPHLVIILTKHACHHNSFWGSRCDSNHAPTVSLKLVHFHGDFGTSFWLLTQVSSRHTSSLTSDHPRYFELFRPYFLLNLHISAYPYQTKFFQSCYSEYSKNKPNIQMLSTTLTMTRRESSFNVKLTKILRDFGGRGLPASSTFSHGCEHFLLLFIIFCCMILMLTLKRADV